MLPSCPATLRPGSKIILIGEAPGSDEVDKQEGFSGKSGRILNKALHLANIQREECSLSNVMKEQPPRNDFSHFYLDGDKRSQPSNDLLTGRSILAKELEDLKPNVAVALGDEALFALTGQRGITKWRGSILPSTLVPGVKVVPSLHPAWILRGQFQHFWSLVGDLGRAQEQSHFPDIRRRQYNSHLNPSPVVARDFLRSISDAALWCLDIETRAGHLACFSIAAGNDAMCFPLQNPGGPFYLPAHEAQLWREVQALMDRNPNLVGQNLTFDLEYLFDYGLEPSGIYMDTMLSHAILYPELPKSLAFLCALYTEMPFYKDEGKVSNPKTDTKTLHEYNNKDTFATLWCAEEITKQLKQRGLWPVHEFVTQEISLALEMQRSRLYVDQAKRAELKALVNEAQADLDAKWARDDHERLLKKLAQEIPFKRPNVNSPKQVAEFLYEQLKLPKKTWQGKVIADETALTELRAKYPKVEEINWILEERHLRKLNSSYLDIELEPDGTLGGGWCPNGTETGRWTSGKGPRGRGLNLQTVPKAIRWMITPPIREAA